MKLAELGDEHMSGKLREHDDICRQRRFAVAMGSETARSRRSRWLDIPVLSFVGLA